MEPNKGGRPRKYKTEDEIIQRVTEYFNKEKTNPTIKGLTAHLELAHKSSLYDYIQRDGYDNARKLIFSKLVYTPNTKPRIKTGIKYINESQYNKERYRKYPALRLRSRISAQIRQRLKTNEKGAMRHLPYTVEMLKEHLERQFKPGMGWHNMDKWHIDHIIPVSAFNFQSVHDIEFKQCFALENLQPLWARENLSKGDTIQEVQIAIGI